MTRRALLVIDVQNEYEVGALPITFPPLDESLAAIGRVIDAAHADGVLIVVVQQDMPEGAPAFAVGSPTWELHPVVANRPHDRIVHKLLPGAFTGTNLEEWLREREVDTVTCIGYMTQHCVDSTARQAMHAGFRVEVLSDATGTLAYSNPAGTVGARDLHVGHLAALSAGIAAVATTDDWLQSLATGDPLPLGNPVASAAAALELTR